MKNVLITGGCSFIGSYVAEKFFKEGYKVYIIDNLSIGKLKNLSIKYKFYNLDIRSEKCEEIFKVNEFDFVIHMAEVQGENEQVETNVLGMVNILSLSNKYNVKKFAFLSSAAVYGDLDELPASEESLTNPKSCFGLSKLVAETFLNKWCDMHGMKFIVFRISNAYGPKQVELPDYGVVANFIGRAVNGHDIVVYGDGRQTRDFIYVKDVAEAVFMGTVQDATGTFNLSSNTETSLDELIEVIKEHVEITNVCHAEFEKHDVARSRLNNFKLQASTGWNPVYSLQQGIMETCKWYENNRNLQSENVNKKENKFGKHVPTIENFTAFLMLMGGYFHASLQTRRLIFTNVDFNYLYIAVFGAAYGLKQSIFSAALSTVLYVFNLTYQGMDLIVLTYEPKHLIHVSGYMLLGIVLGYSIDQKTRENEFLNDMRKQDEDKFNFICRMYDEARVLKNELQKQVVSSRDSFANIYKITRRIQSFDEEHIFDEAVSVVEEIMKSSLASIYLMSPMKEYLRLKSRSKNNSKRIPASVEVKRHEYLKNMIDDKRVFVNRKLESDLPMLAAPLTFSDEVMGVVFIHEQQFERMTLYYENLFKITVQLISDSLGQAYEFQKKIEEERYVEGTRILKANDFNNMLEKYRNRKHKAGIEYTVLRTGMSNPAEAWEKLQETVRDSDYIGIGQDGNVWVVLTSTANEFAHLAIERMKRKGVNNIEISYDS